MHKKLMEAGFLTVNIGEVVSPPPPEEAENSEQKMRRLLRELLAEKKGLDKKQAKPIVDKLMALGDPFKKAINILGYNIEMSDPGGANPLLAFLLQEDVMSRLLLTGIINLATFKVLYNAVANNTIADSEFFAKTRVNTYNIIYCEQLYYKSAKEMTEYLKLQSQILKVSDRTYDEEKQILNRKTFFDMPEISELDVTKRAQDVKASTKLPPTAQSAKKLNSLQLARAISGRDTSIFGDDTGAGTGAKKAGTAKAFRSIAERLTDIESKYALIVKLCTNNQELSKKVLDREEFGNLDTNKLTKAFSQLAAVDGIPKTPLSKELATLLLQQVVAILDNKKPEETKET